MTEIAWSKDEHFREGLRTISDIFRNKPAAEHKPRVCFHLSPQEPSEDEPWNQGASYCRLAKPLFENFLQQLEVDYVGGTSGIEAYEYIMPSAEWLEERLPQLMGVAQQAQMTFEGWSFEPIEPADAPYFSCGPNLKVFNARSPEGRAAIERLKTENDDECEFD